MTNTFRSRCCKTCEVRNFLETMNMHIFNKSKRHKKGQSVAEYSILLVMVAVVLTGAILGPFQEGISDVFGRLISGISDGLSIWKSNE